MEGSDGQSMDPSSRRGHTGEELPELEVSPDACYRKVPLDTGEEMGEDALPGH